MIFAFFFKNVFIIAVGKKPKEQSVGLSGWKVGGGGGGGGAGVEKVRVQNFSHFQMFSMLVNAEKRGQVVY